MPTLLQTVCEKIFFGQQIDAPTVLRLIAETDQDTLLDGADKIRSHFMGARFHLCSIINAKSGNCSEDCRFCAQSARYQADIKEYDIINAQQALDMALENDSHNVQRLSLVTSGRSISEDLLEKLSDIYRLMEQKTALKFCASMGLLTRKKAEYLVDSGVTRYHCNLESSRKFFQGICTTHSWEDKVETLQQARHAGMTLCSGGIIGMGESMADRVDLALEIRELGVKSIPVNILTPIAHTPFADIAPLSLDEILVSIACFRFLNPDAVLRIAGGRQLLGQNQYRCFSSGANGAIVGDYLTTLGSKIADDLNILSEMGYTFV
jgi:biotin synthase